jgi:hypothetical protein
MAPTNAKATYAVRRTLSLETIVIGMLPQVPILPALLAAKITGRLGAKK